MQPQSLTQAYQIGRYCSLFPSCERTPRFRKMAMHEWSERFYEAFRLGASKEWRTGTR